MADSARARRLAKRIVTIVATELQHQVKDPRLAMVTVTAATVTPDLREATVFYTVYGDEGEIAGTAAGTGQRDRGAPVRGRPADRHQVHPDAGVQAGHRAGERATGSTNCWRRPVTPTPEVAERAAGASYAGDPDPYKAPRIAGDEADEEADEAADTDAATTGSDPVSVRADGGAQVPGERVP